MARAWRLVVQVCFAAGEMKTRGPRGVSRMISGESLCIFMELRCFVDGVDIVLVWYDMPPCMSW